VTASSDATYTVLLNVITPLGALGIPFYGWLMDKKGFAVSYAVINLLGIGNSLRALSLSLSFSAAAAGRCCCWDSSSRAACLVVCVRHSHQRAGVDPGASAPAVDVCLLGGLPAAGLLGLLCVRR
jgi:hypothetical protein